VTQIVQNYSQSTQKSPLRTCGLYIVGSSLTSPNPNDVDIVLVGLDFRSVFAYKPAFVNDLRKEISQGDIVSVSEPGILPVSSVRYFNGKSYALNPDISDFETIGAYCGSQIKPSEVTDMLKARLQKDKQLQTLARFENTDDLRLSEWNAIDNPLHQYGTQKGEFLCSRLEFGTLDFLIHAENMLVSAWKLYQNEHHLPFVPLYEWSDVGITSFWDRATPYQIPLPSGIDPLGKKRACCW
jgi:hypothetical protein